MNILGLINKNSGPGFHRVMMPLLMMDDHNVYITNSVKEEDFVNVDYIYYNRIISDNVLAMRDKYGFKVAVDVDDYWRLDYHHIAYTDYIAGNFESMQIKHLQAADVVTTTHERLAEKILPYNQNVVIVPNAIPNHEYFQIEKTLSEKVRIFWQGSITHEKDIELLRGPFKRLGGKNVHIVVGGYTKHETWDRMVSSLTNSLSISGSILPGVDPRDYYKNYSFADICLAPLVKSEFNSMKSNLKILEAAYAGLPVIASKVDPYLGLPVLYVEKQSDWFKHINAVVNDADMRDEYGAALKSYCHTYFNFDIINQTRKELFV